MKATRTVTIFCDADGCESHVVLEQTASMQMALGTAVGIAMDQHQWTGCTPRDLSGELSRYMAWDQRSSLPRAFFMICPRHESWIPPLSAAAQRSIEDASAGTDLVLSELRALRAEVAALRAQ